MSRVQASPKGWQSPALTMLQEDEDYLAEIVERYEDGATIRELAAELGVSLDALHSHLKRGGAKFRSRGTRPGC